jgi:hypothetical protein
MRRHSILRLTNLRSAVTFFSYHIFLATIYVAFVLHLYCKQQHKLHLTMVLKSVRVSIGNMYILISALSFLFQTKFFYLQIHFATI